jgi:methylamine dehydrogenase accessory protein MauD
MNSALLIVSVVLCVLVLFLGFLVLGTLRALGVVTWRVEQLEMITPSRIGRDGIKVGKKAPDFTLPSASNGERSLRDYSGRKLLLVFTQSGCGPCRRIVPELNRVQAKGECQVLVINNGGLDETRKWATQVDARFPILAQEKLSVSKRYEAFVTPFVFLIDEHGVVVSKGIVGRRQYLHYVLTGAGNKAKQDQKEPEADGVEKSDLIDNCFSKEMTHV